MAVIHTIFDEARARPDRTALVFDGHALTYGYFARCIAETADWLRGRAPPGLAIICAYSLLEAWILGLALRSLGHDTLTVRVARDIEGLDLTGGVAAIVTLEREARGPVAAAAERLGCRLVGLPASVAEAARSPGTVPVLDALTPVGGHILLTSGTTGVFKQVRIDAVSESANALHRSDLFEMDADTVLGLFDFGGWTSAGHNIALCAWGVRGTVVIRQHGRPHLTLADATLTHAIVTPHLLGEVLSEPDLPRLAGLRLIVISGALSLAAWEAARARLTSRIFTNFGSTETGPFCQTPIESAQDLRWHAVHRAREVQVVDEADRPVGPGVLGLLRVRIVDAVSGYEGDPATTAQFFKGGWFYPGDLAQIRADGRVGLFGRVTDIINIAGNKHPAGPVEAALQEALGVDGVVVFSLQNADAEEEAHVVIEAPAPVDEGRVAAVLNATLAGFPHARLHYLAKLPRTSTGKVARAALKTMLAGR